MARNNELQLRKEADIKAAIARFVKERKLCLNYIIDKVAYDFYLMPNTVWRIYWGEYDNRRTGRADKVLASTDDGQAVLASAI